MLPETCKESGEAYLQWDLYHHKTSGKECTPPHLHVHQVRKDYQVKGSNPEVVHKKEGLRKEKEREGSKEGSGEEKEKQPRTKRWIRLEFILLTMSNLCTSLDARLTT